MVYQKEVNLKLWALFVVYDHYTTLTKTSSFYRLNVDDFEDWDFETKL